jgi:hypothetical protein
LDTATAATFVVAAGTLALAFVSWRQLRHNRDQVRLTGDQLTVAGNQVGLARDQLKLARDAFLLSTRPLLADALAEGDTSEPVQFGAPGRHQIDVSRHDLYFEKNHDGVLLCSVPFRNIGNGVAVIARVCVTPDPLGDVLCPRKFVPPGEFVRVNICAHTGPSMADALMEACREVGGGFAVTITYSDTDGQQSFTTRADLREFATSPMCVKRVSVSRDGDPEPLAVSGEL